VQLLQVCLTVDGLHCGQTCGERFDQLAVAGDDAVGVQPRCNLQTQRTANSTQAETDV
jgi:hypothetical protein